MAAKFPLSPDAAEAPAAALRPELADWPRQRKCTVLVQESVFLGDAIYQTTAQWTFRQERQRATPQGGWVVEVTTLDFGSAETPDDADALVGYLAQQVNDRLLVEVDRTGGLARLLNQAELQAKWAALQSTLRARFRHSAEVTTQTLDEIGEALGRDDYCEQVLRHAPEYYLLFPPIFGSTYHTNVSLPGAAVLPQFWGMLDLPLITEARLAEAPDAASACTLQLLGTLDEARYPAVEVCEIVRELTDRFDVDPTLALLHHERYELGPAPYTDVLHAVRHTHGEVRGVAGRSLLAVLDPLQPEG